MRQAKKVLLEEIDEADDDISSEHQYYLDNIGFMETASESPFTEEKLEELADSFISPIQSVVTQDGIYYGIIDYVEGDECNGFESNDSRGNSRRVIGVREIPDEKNEKNVPHVTAGDPSGSFENNPNATYEELCEKLKEYYTDNYGDDRNLPKHSGPPYKALKGNKIKRENGNAKGNRNNK